MSEAGRTPERSLGYENLSLPSHRGNRILRLRQRLQYDPANPAHLLTIHGLGYKSMPLASAPIAKRR
jgi:DNA-binding response OmpR family regulator